MPALSRIAIDGGLLERAVESGEPQGFAAEAAEPLFSIVMPCYQVAAYLNAAIDAVQAQTCADWELIVVDDASPDGAGAIAAARVAEDERIRVVEHKANRGLSGARNTGLAHARGSYVWIPDPDDLYEPQLLDTARVAFEQSDADLVVFGCVEEYYDAAGELSGRNEVLPPAQGLFVDEALHRMVLPLEESTLYGYAWNKVYKRSVLEGLRFVTVPLIEDVLFNVAVFDRIERAAFVQAPLYRYAKRLAVNLTNRFVPEYYEVHRRRIEELYRQQVRWGLDGPAARERLGSLFVRYIMSALERNCDARAHMDHADRVAWCRSLFQDELFLTLVPGAAARDSHVLDAGIRIVSMRSPQLACALGRVIHIVRHEFGDRYARLKMLR